MTLNQQKLWRLIYFEKTFMKLRSKTSDEAETDKPPQNFRTGRLMYSPG